MKLSPIDSPRIAQVPGANTLSAQAARESAMAKFNEGLTTSNSPSQPGAVLDPSTTPAVAPTPAVLNTSGEAPTEAPVADAPATTLPDPESEKIAAHYANIARKEKALRLREMQYRQRMASAPGTAAPTATQQPAAFDTTQYVNKNDLINNPFGVLNNLGLSYEQLTQKALEAPSHEELETRREMQALKAKIEALEGSQTEVKKTFEEGQKVARQQAETQIYHDVTRLVRSQPDSYEAITAHGASRDVAKLITKVYDQGMGDDYPKGTLLDIYEAADMVESELTERALRMAQIKKIQSRLNLGTTTTQQPSTQQTQAANQNNNGLRTLTNGVGTSSRKLSSRERALAAFRGEQVS